MKYPVSLWHMVIGAIWHMHCYQYTQNPLQRVWHWTLEHTRLACKSV